MSNSSTQTINSFRHGIGRLPDHSIQKELAEGALVELNTNNDSAITMEMFAMRLNNREHGVVSNHIWETLRHH